MQVHVLNLERTPERWVEFRRRNEHLPHVRRAQAVDGRDVYRFSGETKTILAEDLHYTPGAVGCALSHIHQWQQCVADGLPRTILEDDAWAHFDFQQHAYGLIEAYPRFDIIVWGWNWDCPVQFKKLPGLFSTQLVMNPVELQTNIEIYQRSLLPQPSLYELEFCFGTPAYTITPKGAAQLLEKLLPLRNFKMETPSFMAENTGIDVALNTVYRQLRAYVCYPPLVVTANDKSKSTIFEN